MLARVQGDAAARAQPELVCPRVQIHDAVPAPHIAEWQGAPIRLVSRGPARRLHGVWPHNPQLGVAANRHLRGGARVPGPGKTRRAASPRGKCPSQDASSSPSRPGRWLAAVWQRPVESNAVKERVAGIRQSELGHGNVYLQVAS